MTSSTAMDYIRDINIVLTNFLIGVLVIAVTAGSVRYFGLGHDYPWTYIPLIDYSLSLCTMFLGLLAWDFYCTRRNKFLSSPAVFNAILWCYFSILACFCIFIINLKIFYVWAPFRGEIYQDIATYFYSAIICAAIYSYSFFSREKRGKSSAQGIRGVVASVMQSRMTMVKLVRYGSLPLIALLSVYISSFSVFNDWHRYNESTINFQVVINPIVQTALGRGALIDVSSQYGHYAQFFEPILRITGLSILSITSIFAVIILFNVLVIGVTLYKLLDNKLLALAGFITYLYIHLFSGSLWPYELFLQYFPIRTLFPAILLFSAYYYFENPSRILYYFIVSILTFGIFWNLDVGPICLVAFVTSVCFSDCRPTGTFFYRVRKISSKLAQAIVVFGITFSVFVFYLYFRYSTWPDLSLLFTAYGNWVGGYSKFSATSGLTAFWSAPWLLIVTVYIFGLAYSIRKLRKNQLKTKEAMILLLSILGLGVLTYHANNAWPQVLLSVCYPGILIFVLFTDIALKSTSGLGVFRDWKKVIFQAENIFVFMGIFFISFSTIVFFRNIDNPLQKNYVRLHEIIWPSPVIDNEKVLWTIPGSNGIRSTGYIKVHDIAGGNPKGHKPRWMVRADVLTKFFSEEIDLRKGGIAIFSMWDAYLYLKLKTPSALNVVNAHHLMIGPLFSEVTEIIENGNIEWIVLDTDLMLLIGSNEEGYLAIRAAIERNYETIASFPVPQTYYDGWRDTELIIFRKDRT